MSLEDITTLRNIYFHIRFQVQVQFRNSSFLFQQKEDNSDDKNYRDVWTLFLFAHNIFTAI